ncbi:MAG: hypothetical protein HY517_02165 [Candidatus Aenigmarchaeota archaeon]|nr:hypothetical protein [Candidatus Aenigmarchaeota archaeon]
MPTPTPTAPMLNRQQLVDYYSNERIAAELIRNSKGREVAGAFWDGSYDKRPNILQYPSDITQMVLKGVTSFHLSVEHWSNPMALSGENYDRLRTGWDLLIDIDSKLGLEESKLAAKLIVQLLGKYGIRKPGVKFSGRRGFHICVPGRLFPKEIDYKPIEKCYPEIPRVIASFLRFRIRKRLLGKLIGMHGGVKNLVKGEPPSKLSAFQFVEIEKDWGNRHMFRAPFSFNEKTWLVSVPISHINSFSMSDAEASQVLEKEHPDFFGAQGDGSRLLTDAMDWHAARKKAPVKEEKKFVRIEQKILEDNFPPCIRIILNGLEDGKKRSIFTLVNFLKMMNWTPEEIEKKIFEWNERNTPPLPATLLMSSIRYNERRTLKPANCFDERYTSIGVCQPDDLCKFMNSKKRSNPIVYPMKKISKKRKFVKRRGFSCGFCNKEFPSERSLSVHKGKSH